jgi:hypothetical protein
MARKTAPQPRPSRAKPSKNGRDFGSIPDRVGQPELYGRFLDTVDNILSSRKEWLKSMMDPRRDINDECGYPANVTDGDARKLFQELFDREPVPERVVKVLPMETWQVQPEVYEDENPKKETPFEKSWKSLGRQLHGENYHQDEDGSSIYEYLKRADVLSGVGQYGIILMGFQDGRSLSEPAFGIETQDTTQPWDGTFVFSQEKLENSLRATRNHARKSGPGSPVSNDASRTNRLLFLRVFPEFLVDITKWETNMTNPRFGQPVEYNVTFFDPSSGGGTSAVPSTNTLAVHWTRVIHIADNLTSSEVFGVPRMRPVLNRLLDLRKLYAGSAEMYWKGAFPGLSLETHPALGGEADIDHVATRREMENYMNGLQRYLALVGMSAKSLAPQVVDPTAQISVMIEAICIQLGIPKRVFMGSERGELASSQDDAAWNDRLKERQRNYVTPRIVVPFVNRLVMLGVLPTPKGFSVFWPDLTSQSTQEKAQAAFQFTQALTQYAGSLGAPKVFPPLDYFTKILRLSEPEAVAVLENARKKDSNDSNLIPPPPQKPGAPAGGGNPGTDSARSSKTTATKPKARKRKEAA